MKPFLYMFTTLFILFGAVSVALGDAGIPPERIYQPKIHWKSLVGTWEVLADDNPLAEKTLRKADNSGRVLMTLRKDGTCRIFNGKQGRGKDGIWTLENHQMYIKFPQDPHVSYYVYGVQDDFMVTRAGQGAEKDQLWSRVK